MRACTVLLLFAACGNREREPARVPANPDELTPAERAQLAELSPRPALPPDPTNRVADSPAAAALGKALFFDPELSGPLLIDGEHGEAGDRGRVSCHTCHDGPAMDDRRDDPKQLSIGTGRGSRNSPPLIDAAFYRWANWAGRFDSQWSLTLGVIEKPEVMNGARVDVVRRIVEHHRADYEAAFAGDALPATLDTRRFPADARPKTAAWDRMTDDDRAFVDRVYVNAAKSIAAYLRLLRGREAPFDRFVAGQADAIGVEARRGLKLFLAHCKSCHSGPHFTDGKFHALAVAQFGPDVPKIDGGRTDDLPSLLASPYTADGEYSDDRKTNRLAELRAEKPVRGAFRTPTLRNIDLTAPYMHAGQFKTLANVVAFYKAGGGEVEGIVKDPLMKPLPLSERDEADLVAFMKTLTDAPLPAELVDPPDRPAALERLIRELRAADLGAAAETLQERLTQKSPKMMLRLPDAIAAAQQLLDMVELPEIRALHTVMPRSTVELARAVRERGVPLDEAKRIASYLTTVVGKLDFEKLATFDENHSHVIGRDWKDIDYSGESMTWQSQRDDWTPKGVQSFKRAAFIHAYFVGAESLPHWKRVYAPRGKMADVPAP